MKIVVDSQIMAKACSLASKVIPNKTTLPILSSLHVSCSVNALRITASDSENWELLDVPASVELSDAPSSFCISASDITAYLMSIPSQPVTIFLERRGNTDIYFMSVSHSSGKAEFMVEGSEEYPLVRTIDTEGLVVPAEILRNSIQDARFAVCNDEELKPNLASVCLDFKGSSMVVAASDGNRLVRMEFPDIEGSNEKILLNRKCVSLLMPLLDEVLKDKEAMDDVMIRSNGTNVCLLTGKGCIYSRMTELKYPNYDSVIPNKKFREKEAVMNRSDLMSALKRIMLSASIASYKVVFSFNRSNDYVSLVAEDVDFGKAGNEKVKCEYRAEKGLTIALRGTWLKEILSHMESSEVRFEMIDETRQVLIFEENGERDMLMLIMPMFLNY